MPLRLKLRMAPAIIAANSRNKWQRSEIEAYQKVRLKKLTNFARRRSAFYRDVLPSDPSTPLAGLPVLTKATFHDEWDSIVTSRVLRRDKVLGWLGRHQPLGRSYLGMYRVMATSGSTGARTPFAYSRSEWAQIMTTVARLAYWRGGMSARGERLVSILNTAESSSAGAPISYLIGHSLRRLTKGGSILDQSMPIDELVVELNRIQPDTISSFASTLTLLAEAQLRGDLKLSLKHVHSSSEVLSLEAALLIERAFGCRPHNAHAMTECGVLAASCDHGTGMHLLDDMTIVECVDDNYNPVPTGALASRVLITNLWARTLPLIRYEITDRLRLSEYGCSCDRPFPVIESIEGRTADIVRLPGQSCAEVSVRAWEVQRALFGRGILLWQIRWSTTQIILRVVHDKKTDMGDLQTVFRNALDRLDVDGKIPVKVHIEDEITAGATGKVKRFVRIEGETN